MESPIEELDSAGMTYRQILRMLEDKKELIFTILEEDEADFKRNITALRSRDNTKLKNAGMEISSETLKYTNLPCNRAGMVRILVSIKNKKTIRVEKIELPDDSF